MQIFKSKFTGWDEVIAVDFTRTAESVAKTGADLTKWAKQQETKVENLNPKIIEQMIFTIFIVAG